MRFRRTATKEEVREGPTVGMADKQQTRGIRGLFQRLRSNKNPKEEEEEEENWSINDCNQMVVDEARLPFSTKAYEHPAGQVSLFDVAEESSYTRQARANVLRELVETVTIKEGTSIELEELVELVEQPRVRMEKRFDTTDESSFDFNSIQDIEDDNLSTDDEKETEKEQRARRQETRARAYRETKKRSGAKYYKNQKGQSKSMEDWNEVYSLAPSLTSLDSSYYDPMEELGYDLVTEARIMYVDTVRSMFRGMVGTKVTKSPHIHERSNNGNVKKSFVDTFGSIVSCQWAEACGASKSQSTTKKDITFHLGSSKEAPNDTGKTTFANGWTPIRSCLPQPKPNDSNTPIMEDIGQECDGTKPSAVEKDNFNNPMAQIARSLSMGCIPEKLDNDEESHGPATEIPFVDSTKQRTFSSMQVQYQREQSIERSTPTEKTNLIHTGSSAFKTLLKPDVERDLVSRIRSPEGYDPFDDAFCDTQDFYRERFVDEVRGEDIILPPSFRPNAEGFIKEEREAPGSPPLLTREELASSVGAKMPTAAVGNLDSINNEPEQSTSLEKEMAKTESFVLHGATTPASNLEVPKDAPAPAV